MLDELKSLFEAYKKAHNEEIGLYQIFNNIRNITRIKDEQKLMQLTLEFITEMLSNGFEVASLRNGYSAWHNQDVNYVINRIRTEWLALGREPNIGDIAWFGLKSNNWVSSKQSAN